MASQARPGQARPDQETYRDLTVGRVTVISLKLSLGPPVSGVVLGSHRHAHPGAQTEKCPQSHLKQNVDVTRSNGNNYSSSAVDLHQAEG